MSEVTVSAKDKKKDKTDRDKRSQNRSCSDKEKEEIEEATRKSLKAERKAAKAKAKEEKQLAEALEQSRLDTVRQAKELQALSSKPVVPTPLLVLGKQNLFASDKHGNIRGFTPAVPCPFHPNDPFHKERASSVPCTADPNDPFQYLKEAREKFIFPNLMIRKLRRNLALMSQDFSSRPILKILSTTMLA